MDRRSVLKRIGATSIGISTVAAGGASADFSEGKRVEIDGETYIVFDDIDPTEDDVSTEECTCEWCDPYLCSLCGPC